MPRWRAATRHGTEVPPLPRLGLGLEMAHAGCRRRSASVLLVLSRQVALLQTTLFSIAPLRLLLPRFAPLNSAPVKFALLKLPSFAGRLRSGWRRLKLAPLKLPLERLAPFGWPRRSSHPIA